MVCRVRQSKASTWKENTWQPNAQTGEGLAVTSTEVAIRERFQANHNINLQENMIWEYQKEDGTG
jgi:hypothetical protein